MAAGQAHPASLPVAMLSFRQSAARSASMNDDTRHQTPSPDSPAPLPRLVVSPRRSALLAGHDNTLDVLVRVQASEPPATTPRRQPLHLSLVIDRSGSMSGQPLEEARRCAEFVLDGLRAADRLAVVAYDDSVHTLFPAAPVGETREAIRAALRRIDSGGSTDLHGGWLAGVQSLVPHAGPGAASRVILLSDGCANAGLCDPHAIWTQCREVAAAGIGTSTYGLGRAFNEELMIGMARTGHGRSYYGETAEDLMDPFREELELLNAACARRLELEVVAPHTGVRVRMLNDYTAADHGGWWLPDLAYAGEAWAVLRLKVAPDALAAPAGSARAERDGHVHVFSVALRYRGADGEPRAIQPVALALPVLSAAAFASVDEDELVVRRVGELEAADLQRKAREAALRGDWQGVSALLRRAEKLGADNPWIAAVVDELHGLARRRDRPMFAKQTAYGSLRMNTRLAARSESRFLDEAAPQPSYLRRKANPGKGDESPASRPGA
jgi:Ca-activated chloride channel family protein